MSSIASNLSDAVRSDGTLKDASEIIWSYDADETIPFPPCANSHDAHTPSGTHAPATAVTAQALHWTTWTNAHVSAILKQMMRLNWLPAPLP